MEESDKHQLEGLLQARSEDMRQPRARRRRRPVADVLSQPPAAHVPAGEVTARACADCGAPIAPRRLAALPRARRCLDCQRGAERTGAPT